VCALQNELCTLHLLTQHTPTALILSRGDVSAREEGKERKKVGNRKKDMRRESVIQVSSVLINNFNF